MSHLQRYQLKLSLRKSKEDILEFDKFQMKRWLVILKSTVVNRVCYFLYGGSLARGGGVNDFLPPPLCKIKLETFLK